MPQTTAYVGTTNILQPNMVYNFGEVEALNIVFADGEANGFNEYAFTFISGATPTTLTMPTTVKWANELTVEANKQYEINVANNIGLWACVGVTE